MSPELLTVAVVCGIIGTVLGAVFRGIASTPKETIAKLAATVELQQQRIHALELNLAQNYTDKPAFDRAVEKLEGMVAELKSVINQLHIRRRTD